MYNNRNTEVLIFILDAITTLPTANVDFLVLITLIFSCVHKLNTTVENPGHKYKTTIWKEFLQLQTQRSAFVQYLYVCLIFITTK